MTYSPIIPQGEPSPAAQVTAVQTNFAQFAAIFASTTGGINYNHTALNLPNQGNHETILFETQTVDPTVIGDLISLYSKNATSSVDTEPQLFLRIPEFLPNANDPNMPGNIPVQLTFNQVNTTGPAYQSFLIGGYLIFFGSTTNISSPITLTPAPTTTVFAIAFPTFTSANPVPVSTQVLTANTFQIFSSGLPGSYTFNWIAIGKI
jgi:hypothetical protein